MENNVDYVAVLYKCETYKVLIICDTVLVRASIALVKYSHQKCLVEGLLGLHFHNLVCHQSHAVRNLETRTQAKGMEDCYLLSCYHSLLSLLSYSILAHDSRCDTI